MNAIRHPASSAVSAATSFAGPLLGRRRSLAGSDADGQALHVLLVDPDLRSRGALEAGFRAQGFEVEVAHTASEALRALSPGEVPPVAVICEARLWGSADGLSLCAQLRAEYRTAQLPFVLLARELDAELLAAARGVGVDEVVTKPLSVRDVVARIRALCRLGLGGRPLRPV